MSDVDRCWNCGQSHDGPCDDDWIYGWLVAVAAPLAVLATAAVLWMVGVIA